MTDFAAAWAFAAGRAGQGFAKSQPEAKSSAARSRSSSATSRGMSFHQQQLAALKGKLAVQEAELAYSEAYMASRCEEMVAGHEAEKQFLRAERDEWRLEAEVAQDLAWRTEQLSMKHMEAVSAFEHKMHEANARAQQTEDALFKHLQQRTETERPVSLRLEFEVAEAEREGYLESWVVERASSQTLRAELELAYAEGLASEERIQKLCVEGQEMDMKFAILRAEYDDCLECVDSARMSEDAAMKQKAREILTMSSLPTACSECHWRRAAGQAEVARFQHELECVLAEQSVCRERVQHVSAEVTAHCTVAAERAREVASLRAELASSNAQLIESEAQRTSLGAELLNMRCERAAAYVAEAGAESRARLRSSMRNNSSTSASSAGHWIESGSEPPSARENVEERASTPRSNAEACGGHSVNLPPMRNREMCTPRARFQPVSLSSAGSVTPPPVSAPATPHASITPLAMKTHQPVNNPVVYANNLPRCGSCAGCGYDAWGLPCGMCVSPSSVRVQSPLGSVAPSHVRLRRAPPPRPVARKSSSSVPASTRPRVQSFVAHNVSPVGLVAPATPYRQNSASVPPSARSSVHANAGICASAPPMHLWAQSLRTPR